MIIGDCLALVGTAYGLDMTTNDTLRVTDSRTGRSYELPIVDGAIRAIDLRQIKTSEDDFGLLSYDPAFQNTASVRSAITFIDGDKGILRYRGYPIDELAKHASFLDVSWLLLSGELPDKSESAAWAHQISQHTYVHENIKKFIDGFHYDAHPMGILVSTLAALSTFYPEAKAVHDRENQDEQIVRLIAKMPTLAAFVYRHARGLPYAYPDDELSYAGNFLNMMWKMTEPKYIPDPVLEHGDRRAAHPARRSRAELLRQRDARRGQLRRRPVLGRGGRCGGPVRPAARRRERAGAEHAAVKSARSRTCPPTSSGSRPASCA